MGMLLVFIVIVAKVDPQGIHSAQKIVVPCLYGKVKNTVFIIRQGQNNYIPCVLDLYQYGYRICSVFVPVACGIANLSIVFQNQLVNVNLGNIAYILLKVCSTRYYFAFPEFAIFNKFMEKGKGTGNAFDAKLIVNDDV